MCQITQNDRNICTISSANFNSAIQEQKQFFPDDFQPGSNDVIIGRGNKCKYHEGNKKLRSIIVSRLEKYSMAVTKREKSQILDGIIMQIRSGNPNGKFIKQDPATNLWFEAGNFLAKEKISQAFRDALSGSYRSCNDFKKKRRREKSKTEKKTVRSLKRARPQPVTSSVTQSMASSCGSLSNSVNQTTISTNTADPFLQYDMSVYGDLLEPTSIFEMVTKKRKVSSNSQILGDCLTNKNGIHQDNFEFPDELEEIDISGLLPFGVGLRQNKLSICNLDRAYFAFTPATNIHSAKTA